MFQEVYQSDDYNYSHNKDTGEYLLTTKMFNISVTLSGKDAALFERHIELINSNYDEMINKRIEKTIDIHLFYCLASSAEDYIIMDKTAQQ